jgi:hypothetical protein
MCARFAAVIASAALTLSAPAFAQTPATDPSFDRRVENALGFLRSPVTSDGVITGQEDIVLLQRRKLFTVSAGITPQLVSNAFLTPDDARSGTLGLADIGVTMATRIADRVNVHAAASLYSARYQKFRELDYDVAGLDVGADMEVRTPLGPAGLSISYMPTIIFRPGFGERQLTQHRGRLGARVERSLAPLLGRARERQDRLAALARSTRLVSSVELERTWANPADYENRMASIDVAVVTNPSGNTELALGVGAYVRRYDHYFPDLLGTNRNDDGVRVGLSASWQPRRWIVVSASMSATRNRSTSDVNGFDNVAATPSISLRMRF